jgi:Ca2+-binding RTX toxin-like protein/alpha-tubulin suppressor-like RCC1 family protein
MPILKGTNGNDRLIGMPPLQSGTNPSASGGSSGSGGFAALKSDGSVVTWGGAPSWVDGSIDVAGEKLRNARISAQLKSGVVDIFFAGSRFAALKQDGSVVTWNTDANESDSQSVKVVSGVSRIFVADKSSTTETEQIPDFVFLKKDGAVSWQSTAEFQTRDAELQAKLKGGVNNVVPLPFGFAFFKKDGSVVLMGDDYTSPMISQSDSEVSAALKGDWVKVLAARSSMDSCLVVALKRDGSVGALSSSSSSNQDSDFPAGLLTKDVIDIAASPSGVEGTSYAALKKDGSVVAWGGNRDASSGSKGFASVSGQLTASVKEIVSIAGGFAAFKTDGSVVTWSEEGMGPSPAVSRLGASLKGGVKKVCDYAALKKDGSVVTWQSSMAGMAGGGGMDSAVTSKLTSGVVDLIQSGDLYAAIKKDGSAVLWGMEKGGYSDNNTDRFGYGISAAQKQLGSGVVRIVGIPSRDMDVGGNAFAALKADGYVVTWGTSEGGGSSSEVAEKLKSGVVDIVYATSEMGQSFAAIKSDGSVVTWGNADAGGDSSLVADKLTGGVGWIANPLSHEWHNKDSYTLSGGLGDDTLAVGAGTDAVHGEAGKDRLEIHWGGLSGAMLSRDVRPDLTGGKSSYKGSYKAVDSTGKILALTTFDSVEELAFNGAPVDLQAASAPGLITNLMSPESTTSESGAKVEFSIVLNVAPKEPVTLNYTSADPTEGRVQVADLKFTPANWNVPQKLVVTGVDDFDNDGDRSYTIKGKILTGDLTYNRISPPSFTLANRDDVLDAPRYFKGTSGVDYFQGLNGADRIYGDKDQDNLKGGRGDDRIYGQEDDDRLFGDEGNDQLYGGYDDDYLDGGPGADLLYGEQSKDTLIGGAGNDLLNGGEQGDSMVGGAGNDTYQVDDGADVVNDMGVSSDLDTVLLGCTIAFALSANIENGSINSGTAGNATLIGNDINNILTGNEGRNLLSGGRGNDTLIGGAGNDTLQGGPGVDLASFSGASQDITASLETGKIVGDGTDSLLDVENLLTGSGNDRLAGNDAANALSGGEGADFLDGGAGGDTLCGCLSAPGGGTGEIDTLRGGAGTDLFVLGTRGTKLYDDGFPKDPGSDDYALITDFTAGTDRLQLSGTPGNYLLGSSGVSNANGSGLYFDANASAKLDAGDELIAILRSSNSAALSTQNTLANALFL